MRLDEDTLNKVNRFIDIESYIYYLTRELKQKSEFSLKELLILAYIFYKGENNISLKEIISDILCKQSEIVQIIKSLAKKEYIEKSRNTSDERRIYISVNSIQQELISNKIKFLDNIIFKFNLKNNYSSKSWVPNNSKELFSLYIHLLYLKDYLKNQFKLTFLDFTLLSRVLSKDKDALTLKDLIDSIRFMYPQVVRAINKLNEKDLLTKERFLADERIVLVRTNKKQLDFAINIIKDISKILNKKSFCF